MAIGIAQDRGPQSAGAAPSRSYRFPVRQTRQTRRAFVRASMATAGVGGATLALAACAGGEKRDAGVSTAAGTALPPATVSFLTWVDSQDKQEIWEGSLKPFGDRHPQIELDFNTSVPNTQYQEKLSALLAAGTMPDVFALGRGAFAAFAEQRAMTDLGPLVRRDAKEVALDDFLPVHRDGGLYKGIHYGLSFSGGWSVLYFNVDLFQREGLRPPTASWTWDDFATAGRQLRRAGDLVPSNRPSWMMLVWSHGGELLTPDSRRSAVDSAAAIAGLQFLSDQIHVHQTVSSNEEERAETAASRFVNGRLAMSFGNRALVAQARNITAFKWTAVHVPKGPRPIVNSGINTMSLWTGSKVPDQSWALLKHLTGPAGLLPRLAGGDAVPPRKSVLSHPEYADAVYPGNPDSKAFNRLWAEDAREARLAPAIPLWPEVQRAMVTELRALFAGERSAPDTAGAMARAANAVLGG